MLAMSRKKDQITRLINKATGEIVDLRVRDCQRVRCNIDMIHDAPNAERDETFALRDGEELRITSSNREIVDVIVDECRGDGRCKMKFLDDARLFVIIRGEIPVVA